MGERKRPGVNRTSYKFIKNKCFGLSEDASLPDNTVLVTMRIFLITINVCTAALDLFFIFPCSKTQDLEQSSLPEGGYPISLRNIRLNFGVDF